MIKPILRIFNIFFVIFFLVVFSQNALSQTIRGLHVNNFKTIVGNTAKEDELLQFAQEYKFNYLLLYNLYYIHNNIFDLTDPVEAKPLADFIEKAKLQYNMQVGAVGEKYSSFTKRVDPYQTAHASNPNQQFDVYHIEFEFWNSRLISVPGEGAGGNDGIYCTDYLIEGGYSCDQDGAFAFYDIQIEQLAALARTRNVISEAYIGWPTAVQSKKIGETLDRVLVHYFRKSDVYSDGRSIYNYGINSIRSRIKDLAPSSGTLTVLPLFASRANFMKPWLETHPIIDAYNTFMDGEQGYNADVGSWKNHINIGGYHWYRYTDLSEVPGLKYADIEDGDIEIFSISQTGYTVYEATDGTLYLVSDNGVDFYKVVDDNGTDAILKITTDKFNAANVGLETNHHAFIKDFDNDGTLDLVLESLVNTQPRVVIRNLAGNVHTITRGDTLSSISEEEPIITQIGNFDTLKLGENGVSGWAYDPSDPSRPIDVRLYVNDSNDEYTTVAANKPRPDINELGIPDDHGFAFTIPSGIVTNITAKVEARAVMLDGTETSIGTRYFITVKTGSPDTTLTVGTASVSTNKNGDFTYWNVPADETYTIVASKTDACFEPKSIDVTTIGIISDLMFTLRNGTGDCGSFDASIELGASWGMANPGPNYEIWVKTLLQLAASTGYSFHGIESRVRGSRAEVTLIVAFRDDNKKVQYLAWYDPVRDEESHPLAFGLKPAWSFALQGYNRTLGRWGSEPIRSKEHAKNILQFISANGGAGNLELHTGTRINSAEGCTDIGFICRASAAHVFSNGSSDHLSITVEWPYDAANNNDIQGFWTHESAPSTFSIILSKILETVAITVVTLGFGEVVAATIGITGAVAETTFVAAFSSFSSSLLQGENISSALLDGLIGSSFAYVGSFLVNSVGDPTALVGVSGLGCPTGDSCGFMQLLNGFPPTKHLAELHDPFIDWSIKGFASIGDTAWYKIVTIPPFIVPGCLASAGCVTAGIIIASEDEISGPLSSISEQIPEHDTNISLSLPVDFQENYQSASILLSVSVSDPNNLVTKVTFYDGSDLLGEDYDAPYELVWPLDVQEGVHALTAIALDNSGSVVARSQIIPIGSGDVE